MQAGSEKRPTGEVPRPYMRRKWFSTISNNPWQHQHRRRMQPGNIVTTDTVLQPISQQYRRRKVLCEFVAHTAQEGFKYQTIKTYLSAVRNWQVISGMGDPFRSDLPLLEYVLRGVRMDQARNREGSPVERLLITPDILLKVRVILEQNRMSFDNIMLWAVYCTAFLGVSAFSRANRTFSGSI